MLVAAKGGNACHILKPALLAMVQLLSRLPTLLGTLKSAWDHFRGLGIYADSVLVVLLV